MKKSNLSKKNLNKKLKSYTTIALSAIAAEASSQVIYTNINDSTLINNGDFFDIDLNNDGINDIKVSIGQSINTYSTTNGYILYGYLSAQANGLNNGEVMYSLNSYSFNEVVALNSNQSINASNNFSTYGYVGFYSFYSSVSSTSSFRSGQFPGAGEKYFGVKFNIGANTHYGWIRLDVSPNVDTVKIIDFAYDTTANTAILAGDTGISVGIDEVNQLKADFYSQSNRIVFKNGTQEVSEVKVYDLKGQLIERRRLLVNQNELVLKKAYQGIYIVEVNAGESVIRKKLWLESK